MSPSLGSSTTSSLQQSITGESRVVNTDLVLMKYWDGGHKQVVAELPTGQSHRKLNETESKIGHPEVEYPREREHCTVENYTEYSTGRSTRSVAQYRVFDITISRDEHPEEADRIEGVIERFNQLPSLEEELSDLEGFDQLSSNTDKLRQYESIYGAVSSAWSKDSLKGYAVGGQTPREWEIKQNSHGFFLIPRLYNPTANGIIGERLEELGLGKHSISWGGFIVEPDDFDEVYNLLKPFYRTPDDQ